MKKSSQIHFSRAEYQEYLESDHWKGLRDKAMRNNPICFICENRPAAEPHHINYRNIYDVKLNDLVPVCRKCHNLIHSNRLFSRIKNKNHLKYCINHRNDICIINDKLIFKLENLHPIHQMEVVRYLGVRRELSMSELINGEIKFIDKLKLESIIYKDEMRQCNRNWQESNSNSGFGKPKGSQNRNQNRNREPFVKY